jgi:hypothetical protein
MVLMTWHLEPPGPGLTGAGWLEPQARAADWLFPDEASGLVIGANGEEEVWW